MYRNTALIICMLCLLSSCKKEKEIQADIAKQSVELKVLRFDKEFAAATPDNLSNIKSKYPYFFPSQYTDSIWIAKIQDSLQIELREAVDSAFYDFKEEQEEITMLLKHIVYYFPTYTIPTVVTLTTEVDYENRIILTDSLLLIGLDNYLGQDHRFYKGIDRYISKGLDKQYLESDIVSALSKKVISFPRDRSFLAQMVYYGKELYLKDLLIPWQTDGQKIGYDTDQLSWAQANEEQIWRYFVERELLYSTDPKLGPRFLDPAPFSKFRLELDNESPGRLGRYIGWQIVRAFMEKTELPVEQLWNLPAETIFKQANYKPKK
ncbi:gliding motility lipoprotein GldB [Muriicola sp.]|uniref:gliding motility lipoprotein GldB n=1 Tax=Muriicola sp. TaxID=2020856 RepID=UPI003C76348C